jgi:hypothetical protein
MECGIKKACSRVLQAKEATNCRRAAGLGNRDRYSYQVAFKSGDSGGHEALPYGLPRSGSVGAGLIPAHPPARRVFRKSMKMRKEKLISKLIDLDERAKAHALEYLRLIQAPGNAAKASLHNRKALRLRSKMKDLMKQIAERIS